MCVKLSNFRLKSDTLIRDKVIINPSVGYPYKPQCAQTCGSDIAIVDVIAVCTVDNLSRQESLLDIGWT